MQKEVLEPKKLLVTHRERVDAAKTIQERLSTDLKSELTRVMLYGSVAKESDGPESDVDILVTYAGVSVFDENFHNRVCEIVEQSFPLGSNGRLKKANIGKVTITSCSELFYQHPWNYDTNPIETPFETIHLVEEIKKTGIILFENSDLFKQWLFDN